MTSLRLVLDPIVEPRTREIGGYALAIAQALIATAPAGVDVEGIVASSAPSQYERLEASLDGLGALHKSSFDRRTLHALWRRGLARPRGTMVHATDLDAPLGRADADGGQAVVTVHDVTAFTDPSRLPAQEVRIQRALVQRAERFADAVVVPSHAVAGVLDESGGFGQRLRIIPGGANPSLVVPRDADLRAEQLGLPEHFLLAPGDGRARAHLRPLLRALARTDGPKIPLVVLGTEDLDAVTREAGLDPARVLAVSSDVPEDVASVLARASVFVHPGAASGFGLTIIDAMRAGVPVVHPDDPALEELTAEAALVVSRKDVSGYTASLAQHLDALLDDVQTRDRLRIAGRDRAELFDWRDSAEKIWQLHAEL